MDRYIYSEDSWYEQFITEENTTAMSQKSNNKDKYLRRD